MIDTIQGSRSEIQKADFIFETDVPRNPTALNQSFRKRDTPAFAFLVIRLLLYLIHGSQDAV